jgi:hypothetical protein
MVSCYAYKVLLSTYAPRIDAHFAKRENLDAILKDLDREFPAALALPEAFVEITTHFSPKKTECFKCRTVFTGRHSCQTSPKASISPVAASCVCCPDTWPGDTREAWRDSRLSSLPGVVQINDLTMEYLLIDGRKVSKDAYHLAARECGIALR